MTAPLVKYDAQEEARLVKLSDSKEQVRQDVTRRMYDLTGLDPENPDKIDFDKVFDADKMMTFKTLEGAESMLRREIKDIDAKLEAIRTTKPVESPKKDPSPKNALYRWVMEGDDGLLAEEIAEQKEMAAGFGPARANSRQFVDPIFRVIDAPDQDVDGGRLTDDTTIQGVVDGLSDYGGILNVATIAVTKNGNKIKYPVADDGTTSGSLRASLTTAATEQALPTFNVQELEAYPVDTGFTQVSKYFDDDIDWDIGEYVRRTLYRRIGRSIEYQATRGTGGAGNPNGVSNVATPIHKTGNNTNIDWRDLIGLIHAVDPAWLHGEQGLYGYRHRPGKVGWLTSWVFLGALRKVQDAESRPLILPDLRSKGGMMLFGYPIHVCQDLQWTGFFASNARPIYFGNFGYFVIRFAGPGFMIEEHYDSGTAKEYFSLYIGRTRMDSDVIAPVVSGRTGAIKCLNRFS